MKAQKALLSAGLLLLASASGAAEWRTWTFAQDGQMKTSAGGSVSFKKKGRLDAALFRADATNAVLLAGHGEYLTISVTNLSELDRSYVVRAAGIDSSEAAAVGQSAIVRNEMTRRTVEAARLREQAAGRRRLAEIEVDAADKLDAQAASLSARVGNLQAQAQNCETNADNLVSSVDSSPAAGGTYVKVKGAATIAAAAAAQLGEDLARLRRQAQEKRQKADCLQREAARLDQIAAEETKSAPAPARR